MDRDARRNTTRNQVSNTDNGDRIPCDLDEEKARESITECRRALHCHSIKIERANYHLQFLTNCVQLDLFPIRLTFKNNINIMQGSRGTELKNEIDGIMKKATVDLADTLKCYYGELLEEETQKRDAANDHVEAVLRTYAQDQDELRDFLELLDKRLNRLSNKLSQRA